MQLVDTHVHLNFDTFQEDLVSVAQSWREVGVVRLVHSCVEPGEFEAIQAIANQFPEVSFAVGLHPLDVEEKWMPALAEQIHQLAGSDPRVVAIGETGLDYYKAENRSQQIEAFEVQLAIAHQLNLPVIIHCRDAASDLATVVQAFQADRSPVKAVMHCWSGTPEETEWFLDLGFYISFSGIVTFKNATRVHESVQRVPADRLLIETDCPFLAPVPWRGKRNQPAYVRQVAERVAELRGESVEAIAAQTTANAFALFDLKDAIATKPVTTTPAGLA